MHYSSKKPVSVESWLRFSKTAISDEKCNLSDGKKETLTVGYIRRKTGNKIKCPVDVVRLLIRYMFIDYQKQHLSICVVGHLDAGKSTLCGRLLYDLGFVTDHELETHRNKCYEMGPMGLNSCVFSDILETHLYEKQRNISVDYHKRHFYSNHYHCALLDAPGHRNYIHNMIYAAAISDVAILMIPANKADFEYSIQSQGNCRQHAIICHVLGIKQLIVCINKMDHKSVDYSENRFNEIKQSVTKMLSKIGFKNKKIPFIPMSGYNGDNVVKPSNKMDWYKGFTVKLHKTLLTGHTLLDAMDYAVTSPKRHVKQPFVLPISKRYKIKGVGHVFVGTVAYGSVKTNDKVEINGVRTKHALRVHSLQSHHKNIQEAIAGDQIGISLGFGFVPKRGDVLCLYKDPNPPKIVKSFIARIYVQNHIGRLKVAKCCNTGKRIYRDACHQRRGQRMFTGYANEDIFYYKGGYTPSIYVHSNRAPAIITKILWLSHLVNARNWDVSLQWITAWL